MAQPVIVVSGGDGQGDDTTSATFAAGVAAATSQQAAQDAATAEFKAETAEATADAAAAAAFDARAEIGSVRADMEAGFERIMVAFGELVDLVSDEVPDQDDGTTPQVVVAAGDVDLDKDKGNPDKPAATGKGGKKRDWFWGDR